MKKFIGSDARLCIAMLHMINIMFTLLR